MSAVSPLPLRRPVAEKYGLRRSAEAALGRAWAKWAPPQRMTTQEWADRYRYLAEESSSKHGKYHSSTTPWIRHIQALLDDPKIKKLVCRKSAQVAWTDGVVNNYIGKRIDIDPCPIIAMFPKVDAAKEYLQEKFTPMVRVTPRLAEKVDVSTARKSGNRWNFKKFPGGFLKLVGSNSPSSVKSTPAPLVIVEEPDDANTNVKGQGDTVRLLEERIKTFHNYLILYGGTPTIDGISEVDFAFKNSDQRYFFVPCHDCGHSHVLDWDNVKWDEDPNINHEVFGHAKPETAYYACPHCGSMWNDAQKNKNVERAELIATADFHGTAGVALNELISNFPGSRLRKLVEKKLAADHKARQGEYDDLIAFTNNTLGIAYQFGGNKLDADTLAKEKGEDYPEGIVPREALRLTIGIDVQHNRFALIVRAWGRGEESWLVYWGEIFGAVTDSGAAVWDELEKSVFSARAHELGLELYAEAISIDASDGQTSDNVYAWVRAMRKKYEGRTIMAVKGASDDTAREIFSPPKAPVDNRTPTKASRYGLRIYQVGTNKAKDLILGSENAPGRLRLQGNGPGRMHIYRNVRSDYWTQITAEVKAPSRRLRGRMVYQKKAGVPNEALDAEVYALHAARAIKLHLLSPAQWDELEKRLVQSDMFRAAASAPSSINVTAPAPRTASPLPIISEDPWLR